MNIKLNGKIIETDSNTILELLKEYKIDTKSIAVALNMEIVKKDNWESTTINKDDSIECLSFFGGG